MTTVNHETFATWLSGWERRLKEPDLLMGRFFVNIVPAALEELEERYLHGTKKQIDRGKQSWERRLLSLLEDVYTHTPQTVDLYRLHYGQDVDRLGQLLSRRGPYDVELIYPILQRIRSLLRRPLLEPSCVRSCSAAPTQIMTDFVPYACFLRTQDCRAATRKNSRTCQRRWPGHAFPYSSRDISDSWPKTPSSTPLSWIFCTIISKS